MKPDIEFEMQQLEDIIKNLEYDFVTATKYSERKRITLEHREAITDLNWLKLEPCLPD